MVDLHSAMEDLGFISDDLDWITSSAAPTEVRVGCIDGSGGWNARSVIKVVLNATDLAHSQGPIARRPTFSGLGALVGGWLAQARYVVSMNDQPEPHATDTSSDNPDLPVEISAYEEHDRSAVNRLVIDTLNGELSRQSLVVGSLYTRSTILVGASGISTALLTRESLPAEWLLPFGCFVATIVLAIVSLWFTSGRTIDPSSLIAAKDGFTHEAADVSIIEALKDTYSDAEMSIHRRRNFLAAGMICFGAGWVISFIILLINVLR